MTNAIEPEVVFNMDLANGPTSARFCYAAAAVLEQLPDVFGSLSTESEEFQSALDDPEALGELVDSYTSALEDAGYCVRWDAGDVVVWDLRPLTDEQREAFYEEMMA